MTAHQVDNDLYRRKGNAWWDDDCGEFSTIRFFVNPVRYAYFKRIVERENLAGRTLGDRLQRHLHALARAYKCLSVPDMKTVQQLPPRRIG